MGSLPVIFDTETSDHRYHVGIIIEKDEKGITLQTKTGQKTFISGRILYGKEIEPALTDEILRELIKQHDFKVLDSTQNYAQQNLHLIKDLFCHAVTAEKQTEGTGSSGKWLSPRGNLHLTLLWPKKDLTSITNIQFLEIVSLSVVEVLRAHKIPAEIKWKNDVKVEEKKISGTLIKFNGDDDVIIIGVGININCNPSTITRLDQETTSMKEALSQEEDLSVADVLLQLERKLYFNIELLKTAGFPSFLEKINAVLRYKNELVTITSDEGFSIEGHQKIITSSGGILIGTEEGEKELMEGHLRRLLPEASEK